MNKVWIGLLVGAALGIIDGATAWFTPEVRNQMLGIIIGSTVKGMIAGVAAGWFARRVRSVPAGIAFGFGVGLLLAWAVAAMPDPSGKHYYWEIMLPGSITGAIIGWATQRYGRGAQRNGLPATAMMLIVLAAVNANAGSDGTHPKEAFAKMKTLAGKWDGHIVSPDGPPAAVEYKVTAAGSTIIETLFAGTDYEMVTMYTYDGTDLVAKHYCHMGNQPTMRLNAAASTNDRLVFDFVKVEGAKNDDHVDHGWIRFVDGGRVDAEWVSAQTGAKKFFLARAR
jgi:hypothetical protein